jgi:Flp pilus assembly protein TadG
MNRQRLSRPGQPQPNRRCGTASVELALCLPVLLTLTFGMLETCNLVNQRTRMLAVAYESARYATRPTTASATAATAAQVNSYATTLLQQVSVKGATVTVSPSDLTSITSQTPVTVTITAPLSQNSFTSFVVKSPSNLTAQATLVFE